MSFKPFVRQNCNLGSDGITLSKGGRISFSGGFRSRHNLDRYTSVELFVNEPGSQVALKLSTAEPSATVARIVTHGRNGREANAASFVEIAAKLGYPIGKSLAYTTKDDGLIVIEKQAVA